MDYEYKFNVVEYFKSIQGEGLFTGNPSLFIRLATCNRKCDFCDTEINKVEKEFTLEEMKDLLMEYATIPIIWTGGEPLLHWKAIKALYESKAKISNWQIETNGDLLDKEVPLEEVMHAFNYVVISPKCLATAKRIYELLIMEQIRLEQKFEIKVATDLKTVNVDLIKYATTLMPLSTKNEKETKQIKLDVAQYCIENNLRYSPRLQVDLWGYFARGV